ncbi:MAG: cadmium-translocating P-type ATPase [Clostridia bacterium]|nr:cadmium-translocating P-type ATPase [Clostridia bacterium]
MKKYEFILEGLDCANCANKIQYKFTENINYYNVVVNFNTLKLSFETEDDFEVDLDEVSRVVKSLEPDVIVHYIDEHYKEVVTHDDENEHVHDEHCEHEHEMHHEHEDDKEEHNHDVENKTSKTKKKNNNLLRILCGLIVMLTIALVDMPEEYSLVLSIVAYIILLFRTTKNAIKLLKSKVIEENFLITVSCIGAFIIGERFEGLMVIFLYEIGKYLEDKAVNNTRKSIAELMDIRPEYANLLHKNHEHKVDPSQVNIGDIIVVKQGEKIPLDGIVVEGEASLNTASLTGESKPVDVKIEDRVLSGSINVNGLINVRVTEKYEDSTVAKILHLVENATDKKAKTETFVNRASRIYTPVVLILALLVAIGLPVALDITYTESIYRALIFLVVSCPCAIVISVPLSYFSGIGKASKKGILIKGSNYIDAVRDIKYIAFDKTGTLTKGKFEVEKVKVYDKDFSEDEVLEYAAYGESFSNHPLAIAILDEYSKTINKDRISGYKEVAGNGITYKYDNKKVKIGNAEFTGAKEEKTNGTCIYIKLDDIVIGSIILSDTIKEESKSAITALNKLGIKTMMFTGDNVEVAKTVASIIGIKEVKAEMLPNDKYNEIEKLIKNKTKGNVAFVGDGINDAPVLALADVGIAMGGIGASSAIEASDVVIMTDNLNKVAETIKLSKFVTRVIKQNLMFAFLVKLIVLELSVFGLAQMWMAIFADVGVTLLTILNTMRILWKRK